MTSDDGPSRKVGTKVNHESKNKEQEQETVERFDASTIEIVSSVNTLPFSFARPSIIVSEALAKSLSPNSPLRKKD